MCVSFDVEGRPGHLTYVVLLIQHFSGRMMGRDTVFNSSCKKAYIRLRSHSVCIFWHAKTLCKSILWRKQTSAVLTAM